MSTPAVILIDHGSTMEEANTMLSAVAEMVQSRLGPAVHVAVAHMELAEPTIDHAVRECVEAGATEIVAHPYMLAPGRHATRDIPRLVNEAVSNHPGVVVRVTSPLGVHAKLVDVILDRCGLAPAERSR